MNGRIMIARMIDAARIPDPFGIPEKRVSQTLPTGAAAISGISMFLANNGANTNSPHIP